MACSTTRLVPSRLGLGFFLVLERVGMAHSGTSGTEPSRSAIFKLTHYPKLDRRCVTSREALHQYGRSANQREHPDLRKGLGGSNDCLTATQSAIFAFFARNSKLIRMFAHFLRPEGTGEAAQISEAQRAERYSPRL